MTVWWTARSVKALREALGLNQQEFGRLIKAAQRTVSGWERGESKVNRRVQVALDSVLVTLDPVARARFAVLAEEDDVNRRQFLMTATALTVAGGAPTVTPADVDLMRSTVHQGMLLDDSLGSETAKPLVDVTAQTCLRLLPYCPELLRPQLECVTAKAVASSGWAAWDQRQVKTADALFAQAYQHADASGDTDIQAGIMAHRTDLAVWTRRYADAADHADYALGVKVRDGRMADYRALRAAQAFAHANRRQDARRQLNSVSGDHVTDTTPDKSYAYWMAGWVTYDVTGSVLEATGDRRSAADSVEESLRYIPDRAGRHRALTLLRLARITAPLDLDRSVVAAKQAIVLSRTNTSPRLRQKYADTRALLNPWDDAAVVRGLDAFAEEQGFTAQPVKGTAVL